jgi:hypothetical protein
MAVHTICVLSRFNEPMILVPILLILFACWSLWGWTVGDTKDIRWIRHFCGSAFVLSVALIAGGGGFMVARSMERSAARDKTFDVLQAIADRIESGDQQRVLRDIRKLDHQGDPDEDAYDLLDELPELTAKLNSQSPAPQAVAEETAPLHY